MSERDGRVLTSRSEDNQHTPGPWIARYYSCEGWDIYASGEPVNQGFRDTFSEADARLIARAPELLQFAKAVLGDAMTRNDDALAEYAASLISLSTGRVLKWRESNGSSLKNSTEGMVE